VWVAEAAGVGDSHHAERVPIRFVTQRVDYLAGPGHFWVAFLGLIVAGACMYAPYGPFWALLPEMVPRNVVGESMALINSAGALGGFFGTYCVGWLINRMKGNAAAFTFMAACLVASAALTTIGQQYAAPLRIVETVVAGNAARKAAMADKVVLACGGSLRGRLIAILGLTFKPNTDDMREAPSLVIVPALEAQGASVRAYDPHGMAEARKLMAQLETATDPYTCVAGADAVVIITEWEEFRALDLQRVKALLKSPVVVDLRNIYEPAEMAEKGFHYVSVGRG